MAETSKNKIYYNDNENSVADVLADMKKMAESTDEAIEKSKYNDAAIKKSISDVEKETNTALSEITQTTESIKSRVETTENTVETINGELKLKDNVNGYPIHIENAGAYKAIDYTVAGNSEQKTRSGKNKLKINNGYSATSNGVAISISNDGTITLNGTATAQVNFSIISNNPYLTSNLPYTLNCIYTAGTVNGTATLYLQDKNNSYDGYGLKLTNSNSFSKITFKNDMTLQSNVFRIASGTALSNYKIKFQLVQVDKNDYDYEEYGASPSPDFPSSIKTVGIKSFIKDSDIHTSNNSLYYLGKNYLYSNNDLSECIELEANTTYTFSCKTYTNDNKLTLMDSSKTALTRVTLTGVYTFTTTQKCWLHYYSNGNTEQPKWQLINCGTQIDDLSYGNWLINKITGKNLLKLDDKLIAGYTTTVQGITYTFNQNGSITISGTTGANISSIVLLGDNLNNYATKRWHEDEDIVVNFSVAGLALNCRLTSGTYSSLANAKGRDVGVIYLSVNPNTTIDTTIYPFVTYEASNSFEIYKENIIKLNLQGNELAKIDDVCDEVNIATGILTKRIGKVVLDGSEYWEYDSKYNYFRSSKFNFGYNIPTTERIPQISNYFIVTNDWGIIFRDNVNTNIMYALSNTGYKVCVRNTDYSNVEEFKQWLSTHNTEVYYVLETPETIQLEAQKIELFEGENNVKIISDLNPSTTHLNYYTKSGLNGGAVLYNSETGSNGAITLSDTSANYTFSDIYFKNNDDIYSFTRVYNPNGKKVELLCTSAFTNALYLKGRTISIDEENITTADTNTYTETCIMNGSYNVSGNNQIYITTVIGYI